MVTERIVSSKVIKCVFGGIVVVLLFILLLQVQPAMNQEVMEATPASELKRLRADMMKNYDKRERPVKNQSIATNVHVFYYVRNIVDLDENYQILKVNGLLCLDWVDEHLTWDPASYSGISSVRFSPGDIWLPDVHSIYNVKAVDIYNEDHETPVIIDSKGFTKWYPNAVFDVPCNSQYRHYPFDQHNCTIVFGAWMHGGDEIILETPDLQLKPSESIQSAEWIVKNVTHSNDVYLFKEYYKYHMVRVYILLQRASRIYRYICVVPTLISLISSLFGFWLLPNETSRYVIGCTNIIMMSLLLQHLAGTVPAGKDIPLIAEYCASCLCMSAVFVLITVITNLLRESSATPPNALVRFARQSLDRYLCLFTFSQFPPGDRDLTEVNSENRDIVSLEETKKKLDWICVSVIVDRIAFWIFVFVYIVLLSVLASI